MKLRMFLMPAGMQWEGPPRVDNRKIVARSAHKLQSDRQILLGESAGNGHCRKPADIANAAERIWKCQIGLEIQPETRRCTGLRVGARDVKCLKQSIHFTLYDLSQP